MSDHITNRKEVLAELRREILGPDPRGDAVMLADPTLFETPGQSFRPHFQKDTGQEILTRDRPSKRYGAGILYPWRTTAEDGGDGIQSDGESDENEEGPDSAENADGPDDRLTTSLGRVRARVDRGVEADADDDLDLSAANQFRPSVMAVSCLTRDTDEGSLRVIATGGRYEPVRVRAGSKARTWWRRIPVEIIAVAPIRDLRRSGKHELAVTSSEGIGNLSISIEVYSREHESGRLLTVCVVNRTLAGERIDNSCLFQSEFVADITGSDGSGLILPYPSRSVADEREELELELLYRRHLIYGVGHGCAADWVEEPENTRATAVKGVALPVVEVPNITPEITRSDGTVVSVSMAALGGMDPNTDGFDELEDIIELYDSWISERRRMIPQLEERFHKVAEGNMVRCSDALERMRKGLDHLRSNPQSMDAFKLANRAILLQQLTGRREPRTIRFDKRTQRYHFDEAPPVANPVRIPMGLGRWRPFQIAFFLMSLESVADSAHNDRDLVELIWFPTGGGKTEAYLALSAFSIFLRRLRDVTDTGVDVLMRYTLRLLTAQQFQRASRLVCAMDYIRRNGSNSPWGHAGLGDSPFSIGIWLGTSTTPNTRKDALKNLRGLERRARSADDWLVVRQCPWCGAEMGVIESRRDRAWPERARRVIGYEQLGDRAIIRCPDRTCPFNDELPIFLIDEDVYERRPSLVIGTVDKFALLAWRPEARSLFGIAADGQRAVSPPTLILQDELHLISGPLGSLVGLYEGLVERLCSTTSETGGWVKPKIVCSTATIRRFAEQVQALYARNRAGLFPPPGLEAGDSFFARYARDREGNLLPGKLYVGVHAPGLGSVPTAQVRSFSALLQAPVDWSPKEKDPWWTLVVFYNSLRELGTALSLLQSDIPDYLNTIRNRRELRYEDSRRLYEVHELTGRLRDQEIPEAIEMLERTPSTHKYPVDVCVASNIIEVGIDIDRLSLMAVVGQPKTTAQYIQVTGRVGRRWWERPGLVVTVYSPTKPRDRSHFEQFRSYHERLYAQVEPTSVTPLSRPALERALHAIMVAFVRQTQALSKIDSPYPLPGHALDRLRQLLEERAGIVDPEELGELKAQFSRRLKEWRRWKRTIWEDRAHGDDAPLIHAAGSYVPPGWVELSWPTPLSMRNVDAECQAEISQTYLSEVSTDD